MVVIVDSMNSVNSGESKGRDVVWSGSRAIHVMLSTNSMLMTRFEEPT